MVDDDHLKAIVEASPTRFSLEMAGELGILPIHSRSPSGNYWDNKEAGHSQIGRWNIMR